MRKMSGENSHCNEENTVEMIQMSFKASLSPAPIPRLAIKGNSGCQPRHIKSSLNTSKIPIWLDTFRPMSSAGVRLAPLHQTPTREKSATYRRRQNNPLRSLSLESSLCGVAAAGGQPPDQRQTDSPSQVLPDVPQMQSQQRRSSSLGAGGSTVHSGSRLNLCALFIIIPPL